jgi:Rad3-related DNA helicase
MALKRIHQSSNTGETPEEMFRDIKNRKVLGALPHQAAIWREYCKKEFIDSSDIALQLPTGSGKTLVGLGIAEWRRRRFKERVVYLCSTTQLVNQVVEQSHIKYGIRANAFTGSRRDYSPTSKAEYASAEAISVTNYNALFNTNPFFDDADIIILDDAHAAENYISKYWSLLIERFNTKNKHDILFKVLISALRDVITSEQYSRLVSQSPDFRDSQWVEKIPTPYFYSKISELIAIFDEHTKDNSLQYPWSIIRDHLFACQMYTSVSGILVRPVIPPTRMHPPFAKAKQRIYMSATLGEGGELERIAGVEKITRLAVEGWDKQGIGRRFFFFPQASLNEEAANNLSIEMIKKIDRALVLVPDDDAASQLKTKIAKETGYKIFDATQIEKSKQPFMAESKAVAVVANRYDGIDLPDDECRLLIVSRIQRATNLQEKFLVTRMPAGILFTDRILTRIVQAVGRCTRSDTDYAAVVILGEELSNKYLLSKNYLIYPYLVENTSAA